MFDTHGRIKCGTIATPDYKGSLSDWTVLGFQCVAEGKVTHDLATIWGAPKTLGARTALLQPLSGAPSFVRLVEQPAVLAYLPFQSLGWASYEFAVQDVIALKATISRAFRIIRTQGPASGTGTAPPLQAIGRAGEVLHFTETHTSVPDLDLPRPKSGIDHIFIAIIAAADRAACVRFQTGCLGFDEGDMFELPYGEINVAFRRPDDATTIVSLTRVGRLPVCEVDQYPAAAAPRMQLQGYLAPGNSIISIAVDRLETVKAGSLTKSIVSGGPLYGSRRAACVTGPAGELFELIEIG